MPYNMILHFRLPYFDDNDNDNDNDNENKFIAKVEQQLH